MDTLGPCREWPGSHDGDGSGRIRWGQGGYIAVHRLVWIAAHGDVPEVDGRPGLVLHRCDNPPCFRLDHLYVASHADNMRDRGLAGHAAVYGEANGMSKLTEANVREIRAAYNAGATTQARLALTYDLTQQQVSAIVRHQAWAHVR
jgi:hypothetical protein